MQEAYKNEVGFHVQREWATPLMYVEMSVSALGGGATFVGLLFDVPWLVLPAFLLTAILKGLMLVADLGKPARFLRVFKRPFGSWMSFGAWGFLLFCVFGLVYGALFLTGAFGVALLVTKVLFMVFSIVLISYEGLLMTSAVGIGAWNGNSVIAIMFFCNAVVGGLGVLFLVEVFAGIGVGLFEASLAMLLLLCEGVCLCGYMTVLKKGRSDARQAYETLVHNSLKGAFIGGLVFVGIILPLELVGISLLGIGGPLVLGISAVCQIVAPFLMRYCILKASWYASVA